MIEVEKLIEASGAPEGREQAEALGLAAFCEALAEQLIEKAREKAKKNQRGHKSYGEHIGTAVVELNALASLLRKHAKASQPCEAVNQLGARCLRTDVHESHTYPPVHPVTKSADGASLIVENESVCGIEDRWTTHEAAKGAPDRCLKPPHGRDTGHEGKYSKWPWQEPQPMGGSTVAIPAGALEAGQSLTLHASGTVPADPRAETIAYLKGETDELGTEPLPFDRYIAAGMDALNSGRATITEISLNAEPSIFPGAGIVSVTGQVAGKEVTLEIPADSPDAAKITAGVLTGYSVGFMNSGGAVDTDAIAADPRTIHTTWSDNLGGPVQPDPFDNALPDKPSREGVWMGGAKPVAPDPRPLWLGDPSSGGPELPTSIRTTQVRMGEECGLQYRLVSRDQVPEVPSWANIGGSTLHACAQLIEQGVINGFPAVTIPEQDARMMWADKFREEIRKVRDTSPFGSEHWRAANKGAEAEDWWNEVGPLMVRDYSAWSAQMHADGWSILTVPQPQNPPTREFFPPVPAMELEMHTPLIRGELTGHLDQAWYRLDEGDELEIRVRDLKSGRELPDDKWQLEAYPFELRHRLQAAGMDVSRIRWSAVYYDARNGKDGEVYTPRMDTAEIVYRAGSVLAMHANNNYPANPGEGWKAPCYLCAVRYACPIMATRGN